MSKSRRKFTAEERLSIIQEAEREGRIETIRKHSIAPSLFDRWRKKYLAEGINGLKPKIPLAFSLLWKAKGLHHSSCTGTGKPMKR